MQSPAVATDGHTHGKKSHRLVTKRSAKPTSPQKNTACESSSDPSQCESESFKDHDHADGDGHDHGKKKTKTTKPITRKK